MALKDLKSDLGKFRSVVKPDAKAPDPPKPVDFGDYTPVTYVASTYKNAKNFQTPDLLSFQRPSPDIIDLSDVTKLESNYDNDNIKRYNLASKLQNEGETIKNIPSTSGNNENSPVTVTNVEVAGNNEASPILITKVETRGNNESSPIVVNKPETAGNNEASNILINKAAIAGNNEASDIIPIKSNLESKQLVDNSFLNLDSILRTNPSGRHERDNSEFNIDRIPDNYDGISRVIDFNSTWNIDGKPAITMAGGRYELPKKSNYGFIGESPSTDFFSNTFFVGFTKRQFNTSYTGQTSQFSFLGKSSDAPSTNFFNNTNVSEGFHTFAKLGDTKFLFNSQYANIGSVNFFANTNVSDGFTVNMKLYDTKFLNNSEYGKLKILDVFSNQFATGFTEKYKETQFNSTALDYGLKGSIPETNFFQNTNVTAGFHSFAALGDSKFIVGSSQYTWNGNRDKAPSVNFFANTNASGFTTFQNLSEYVADSSLYTWKGGAQNAPEVNFFANSNATGFTKFIFGQPTQFSLESSQYTWKGGRNDAPAVDFFPNTNRDGFKTFNKLYESFYKFDSTSLHEIATTPSELARTGGGTYKLNSQLIKSPLFNNLGFSTGTNRYSDIIKTRQYNSILGETALRRNSPSLIDTQYEKFDLTTDSFNPDYIQQPYILRGIQNPGSVENERWGASVAIADGLIRGGALTVANRTIADVKRITKFMISSKGVGFIVKQAGLHLASQNQETDPVSAGLNLGFNPVKIYNPVAQLLSVAGNAAGQHFTRHGLIPILSNTRYENAVKFRNENNTNTFSTIAVRNSGQYDGFQNRLLQLTKELLFPITDGYTVVGSIPADPKSTLYSLQASSPNYTTYYNSRIINRLSYLTGPGSVYGIGSTIINRATNTIPLADTVQLYGHKVLYAPEYAHDHPNRVIPGKGVSSALGPASTTNVTKYSYDLKTIYDSMIRTAGAGGIFVTDDPAKDNAVTEFRDLNPMWAQIKSPFSRTIGHNNKPALRISKPGAKFTNNRKNTNTGIDPKLHQFSAHDVGNLDATEQKTQGSLQTELIKTYATADPLITNVSVHSLAISQESPIYKFSNSKIKDFRMLLGNVIPDTTGNGRLQLDTINVNDYHLQPKNAQALRAVFTNPKIADYNKNNLIDRFGFGDPGKVGLYRDNPTRTHRGMIGPNGQVFKQSRKFIGDRIQLIDFKPKVNTENLNSVYELDGSNKFGFDGAEDLIEFYISGPKQQDRCIVFRATIGDIQDNFNPSYNTIKYLGRADPIYLYSSFERTVSISFQIGITSRDELRSRWRSINALAAYTAPEYLQSGRMRSPLMKLTLGHLFRRTPVFINSLVYTFDNSQTTWETAKLSFDDISFKGGDEQQYFNNDNAQNPDVNQQKPPDPGKLGVLQLPKFINVRMDLKIIGNYRPQLNGDIDNSPDMGIMYNLYETNDGYLPPPDDKVRVNYFSDIVVVQENNQADVSTQVQEQKPGNKKKGTPNPASNTPSRTESPSTPQYPRVNGDIVTEDVWPVTNYPKQPLPAGYVLVKGTDLALRFVTPSLLEAKSDKYTVVENPDVIISSSPSTYKIPLLRLSQ